MEFLFVRVVLDGGAAQVFSRQRGKLDTGETDWRALFRHPSLQAVETPARALVQFLGDYESVTDHERLGLTSLATTANYGMCRILEGGEPLDPEEAFALLATPFT